MGEQTFDHDWRELVAEAERRGAPVEPAYVCVAPVPPCQADVTEEMVADFLLRLTPPGGIWSPAVVAHAGTSPILPCMFAEPKSGPDTPWMEFAGVLGSWDEGFQTDVQRYVYLFRYFENERQLHSLHRATPCDYADIIKHVLQLEDITL
jgi:hypothetical protein